MFYANSVRSFANNAHQNVRGSVSQSTRTFTNSTAGNLFMCLHNTVLVVPKKMATLHFTTVPCEANTANRKDIFGKNIFLEKSHL